MTRRLLLAGSAAVAGAAEAQPGRPVVEVDVAVIGAGAAGVAAARRLVAAQRSVVVLEAAPRVGGRAHTVVEPFGMPMDLGAHWLHAPEENPIAPLARAAGFSLYPAPERERLRTAGRTPREGEYEAYLSALRRAQRAILQAGEAGREVSVASVLPDDRDWRATVEFLKGPWDSGAEASAISCVDFYNAIETTDMFCREGYGAVIAKLAEGLPIRLGVTARIVDWSGRGVSLETSEGTLRARAAIITVSTAVLAARQIAFRPALPRRAQEAIAALPCGAYEHMIVELAGDPVGAGADEPFVFKAEGRRTAKGLARIGGSDWWYFDVGGDFARELSRSGKSAATGFAHDFVAAELGVRARRAIGRVIATDWSGDALVGGAWSVAGPGATEQRLRLGEPVGDRILFAGEATDESLWGTVGGAWAQGERAAEQALRWLAPPPRSRR